MKELMYDINAGLIAAILLVIALAAIEIGFRFGRRSQGAALDDDSKAHINATQASTLGILALLLAFTFSLSLQRFDTRSDAMVDEANAIGTAYLRAQMLPAPLRDETRALLRDYVDVRVEAGHVSIINEDRMGCADGQGRLAPERALGQGAPRGRGESQPGSFRDVRPGDQRPDRQLRQTRRCPPPPRSGGRAASCCSEPS